MHILSLLWQKLIDFVFLQTRAKIQQKRRPPSRHARGASGASAPGRPASDPPATTTAPTTNKPPNESVDLFGESLVTSKPANSKPTSLFDSQSPPSDDDADPFTKSPSTKKTADPFKEEEEDLFSAPIKRPGTPTTPSDNPLKPSSPPLKQPSSSLKDDLFRESPPPLEPEPLVSQKPSIENVLRESPPPLDDVMRESPPPLDDIARESPPPINSKKSDPFNISDDDDDDMFSIKPKAAKATKQKTTVSLDDDDLFGDIRPAKKSAAKVTLPAKVSSRH